MFLIKLFILILRNYLQVGGRSRLFQWYRYIWTSWYRFETNIATLKVTTKQVPLLLCKMTTFKNAVFNDVNIIQFLKKEGAINLPENSKTNISKAYII